MRFITYFGTVMAACVLTQAAWATVPEQIVPSIAEVGAPTFVYAGGIGSSGSSSTSSITSYDGAWGNTSAMETLLKQTYGEDAVAAAKAAGINPDTLAAFAQVESHFTNTGNSTSSANGVWQITDGTWDEYASKLGLSESERSDPAVQAQVASAIISDYASSVSKATGGSVTGVQAYAAYMFGTSAGSKMATSTNVDEPLSDFVSSSALAANNMSDWTVGQYYSTMTTRMGSAATENVIS